MTESYRNSFTEDKNLLELSDAKLYTDDGHEFLVHRVVLAKSSKYFLALFYGMGCPKNDILIPGIKGEVLSNTLSYIYNGNIRADEENFCDLIVAADYFLLENLVSHLKILLPSKLSLDNSFAIFMVAIRINRMDIAKEIYRFIETHFEEVMNHKIEELCEIPFEPFKQLLSKRNLRVRNENVVWLAIVKWVEADSLNRLQYVPELMMCLKTNDVDELLATEIFQHGIVAKNKFLEKMGFENVSNSMHIFKLRQYITCRIWSNPEHIRSFSFHRWPLRLHFIANMYANVRSSGIQIFVTYDENTDLWRKVTEIDRTPEYLFFAYDYIYIFDIDRVTNNRFSIIEKQWLDFTSFRIPRRYYAVVMLQGLIYVIGGVSAITGVETYNVEVFDTEEDEWYETTPMLPITCFAAISFNESIYVVGNRRNLEAFVMIAQLYDPHTEIWHALPEPSVTRSQFALVAYDGELYVIGGSNADRPLKNVEVFNPNDNRWHTTTSLPHSFYFPVAVVINDKLIVYDSHLEDRNYMKTNPPVHWNSDRKCWDIIPESSPLCSLQVYNFFTVEDDEYMDLILKENKHPETVFERSPFYYI